jgi:4-amino-4-deoxy-L-arabinose transferase-like glycosyltransferase
MRGGQPELALQRPFASLSMGELLLLLALACVAAGMIFMTVFVPLTQNDSLEYATVGRELYAARTIAAYPVLNPETNLSGFVGPWTHPPLYVASIYLAEIIQGHANAPGAMRLLSPWFALTGAGVVGAIGSLVSRPTGLASALIFLSTPLLFLGAGSALLDALYITALAVLVASIAAIEARPIVRGSIIGGLIGLGLWTHSVGILFLPMGLAGIMLARGISMPRTWARELFAAAAFAVAVGGWHYWRNVELFGALVSDNPAVFALPSLFWSDYFVINRGIDTPMAMLQYGILKGWFAPESFSITYWGMLIGFLLLLWRCGIAPLLQVVWRGALQIQQTGVLYIVFGLMIVYLGGAVVSVLLGLDVMVKNERYMLATQCLVAIGAGYGYIELTRLIAGALRNTRVTAFATGSALALLGAVLVSQSTVFVWYALAKNSLSFTKFGFPFAETLAGSPEYKLTEYLRTETPPDAIVLSLKPGDMYYSDRKMISYLDERLLEFYRMKNPESGRSFLKKLGITHIHVPDYGIPPYYNSSLYKVLASSQLSSLLISTKSGQIYSLLSDDSAPIRTVDLTPPIWPWVREQLFFLGGRKRLTAVTADIATPFIGQKSRTELPFGLNQRNVITLLRLGTEEDGLFAIEPDEEISIKIDVSGKGLAGILINEYSTNVQGKGWLGTTRLVSFELSEQQPSRVFERRMRVSNEARFLSVVLEHQGHSTLEVNEVTITIFETH